MREKSQQIILVCPRFDQRTERLAFEEKRFLFQKGSIFVVDSNVSSPVSNINENQNIKSSALKRLIFDRMLKCFTVDV
jgi:hypothetical protein